LVQAHAWLDRAFRTRDSQQLRIKLHEGMFHTAAFCSWHFQQSFLLGVSALAVFCAP